MVLGFTVTAAAQIPDNSVLKAKVPFSFIVNETRFPAGEYTIRQTNIDTDSEYILEISSDNNLSKSKVFQTNVVREKVQPTASHLVFNKYGDKYFLSKIFVRDDADGNMLEPSKMEKKIEKMTATKEAYELNVGHWKQIEDVN